MGKHYSRTQRDFDNPTRATYVTSPQPRRKHSIHRFFPSEEHKQVDFIEYLKEKGEQSEPTSWQDIPKLKL